MLFKSGLEVASSAPVHGVPGVPDRVGPEEGKLAAGLCDLADLGLKMSLKGKQLSSANIHSLLRLSES